MSRLLINEPPLQVIPSLATAIGLNEAIVVQKLHSWLHTSEHVCEGVPWVHMTPADWQRHFPFWSSSRIRAILGSLRAQHVVLVEPPNLQWYAIQYDVLTDLEKR